MQRVVGRIGRAHGIRGELNVEIRTDEPERRFAPGSSVVADGKTLTVKSARTHSGRLVVAFVGVAGRTAAEALHGTTLYVEVDPAVLPADPEEFYDHQLVGLAVRTSTGDEVGTVERVLHLPAQDTLTVRNGDDEILVPFVLDLVPEVHVADGYLVVADIPGLLNPDKAERAGQQ
ncbi:MAG: ribosome maturation factor RimM [Propionibacteriales bacterium]|nr:ribosome maturation factor RimM [Propionibacteriales bacterium]